MSRLHEYNQERTGISFDEVDDLLKPGSSGGATATATSTATPKATSTPTPGDRTFKIGKLWYVVDIATGQPISPGYTTESEANYHATYTYPLATAVPPTATPGAIATSTPTPGGGPSLDPGLYSQDMLAMADVGAGPTAAVQSGGAAAIGAPSPATPTATGAAPPSATAGAKGGTTGTAGGTARSSAAPPNVPPEIAGLLDQFTGFSDKDVVDAYYSGEITRDQLAALITVRNTSKTGETKYTTASLERYLNQVDEAKPEPKRTALDVLGENFGNIGRQYNIKDPQFGGQGSFSSSSAGAGIMDKNLYTANSGGQGLVPMSTPGGNLGLAGAVVNNQYFPNSSAYVQDGPNKGNLTYSGSPASILAQSGVYVAPNTSFSTQMQALGNLVALREFIMQQNPSLSHSQVNDLAVGMMQPANPNHDPSAGALAGLSDAPAPMGFAHGGGMTLKEPVLGMGMYSKEPLFMAAEGGKQERIESRGGQLQFTPLDRDISLGREKYQAERPNQPRAGMWRQRGQMGRDLEVGIPVEGRDGRRAPTTQMLTLMRMLGIPGFATGGMYSLGGWGGDGDDGGYTPYPRYDIGDITYNAPGLEGFTSSSFLNALQSDLQGRQADERQTELNQYNAALNDVPGIANIGRLQRQQQAYDPRFGMAGLNTPVEVPAPLTSAMSALPPGMRYALEMPADRLSQLQNLNEQQRKIALQKLQSPSLQLQADLQEAIDDRDTREIARLLGISEDQVEDIIKATRAISGGGSGGSDPGPYPWQDSWSLGLGSGSSPLGGFGGLG
jgi:hypothetical protein